MDPSAEATRKSKAAGTRSLAPREHGAYGQLLFPLIVAHVVAAPSLSGWCLTAAAIAAFAGHEPLLIVLGRRGERTRRNTGKRAKRILTLCTVLVAAGGVAGLVLAPEMARWSLLLPGALASVVAGFVLRDAEHTLGGELLIGSLLPALAVPVALAGNADPSRVLGAWGVWSIGAAAATGAVRATIAHLKQPTRTIQRIFLPAAALLIAVAALLLRLLQLRDLVALFPLVGVSGVVAWLVPHPRHLRKVGWSLVGATALSAILLCL